MRRRNLFPLYTIRFILGVQQKNLQLTLQLGLGFCPRCVSLLPLSQCFTHQKRQNVGLFYSLLCHFSQVLIGEGVWRNGCDRRLGFIYKCLTGPSTAVIRSRYLSPSLGEETNENKVVQHGNREHKCNNYKEQDQIRYFHSVG
jgi:hypothetical protein